MRHHWLLSAFCTSMALSLSAQHYTGYHSGNFAGIHNISTNAASIADGRYVFDMNLFSIDSRLSNNYIGFDRRLLIANPNINPFNEGLPFQDFRSNYFKEKDIKKQARLFQSLYIQGPSFSFQVGKNAFAVTSAVREMFVMDNLEPRTAGFILDELENPSLWNVDLNNKKFNATAAIWSEFGIAYGREIWSNGEHFLKGGLHLKFILAMASAHFYADELVLNFKNDDTVRVRISDVRFGYSNNLSDDLFGETFGSARNFFNRTTLGADVGFIYEWRPKHADYRHPKDSSKYVRHKEKYKLKAGVALNDIGAIRFDRGVFGGNFAGFSADWNLDTFAKPLEGVVSFGQLMNDTFAMSTDRKPYNIRLPMALNFFADYKIWKGFYVNFTGNIAFNQNNAPLKLHTLNQFVITPRYEHTWFDVGIPIGINGHNNVTAGMNLRLGPLVVGSLDCWNFIFGKNIRGLNVYMGMRVPIPYSKPKDKKAKPEPKPEPEPEPEPIISRVDTLPAVDTVAVVETPTDTVANPNPIVDFPEPDLFANFTDTVNLQNGSTPVAEEEREAVREMLRIKKTYKYVPNIFEFEPFQMELAKGSVYFETGKYALRSEDKPVLDEIAQILKNNPKLRIEIHGHADNVGDTKLNRELSSKRAESVRDYLLKKGAPSAQIVKIDAFGSDNPVADNSSEEGRSKNRRVELILASDGGF